MRFKRITSLLLAIITIISMLPLVSCSTADKNDADLTKSQDPQSPSQVEQSETVEQLEQGEKVEEVMPSAGTDEAVPAELLAEVDTVEILAGDELIGYFNKAYTICSENQVYGNLEENIRFEIDVIKLMCEKDGKQLPSGWATQYREWRPIEEVDLFTDTDETVYATGTVNVRSGPGTSYEKLGQLSWGNSAHRIGIGTGEADGWSKVELSDGTIVYVSNSYLSLVKPVAQQTSTPSTPTQSSGTQSSGGGSSDSFYGYGCNTYEEYIEYMHKEFPEYSIEELKKIFPDQATGQVGEAYEGVIQEGRLTGGGGSSVPSYNPNPNRGSDNYED